MAVRDIPTRTRVLLRRGIIPAGMTAPNVHRAMPGVSLLEVFFTDSMGLAVSRGPAGLNTARTDGAGVEGGTVYPAPL